MRYQVKKKQPNSKMCLVCGLKNRFGLGPYILADEKFYILNEDGTLTLIRASTEKYEQLAQVKILDGRDAWGPMVLLDGRLLLRDDKRMICLNVKAP